MTAAATAAAGSGATGLHRFGLVRHVLRAHQAEHPALERIPTLAQLLAIARDEAITIALPGGFSVQMQTVAVAYQLAIAWLPADVVSGSSWCPRELRGGRPGFVAFLEDARFALAGEVLRMPLELVEVVIRRVMS